LVLAACSGGAGTGDTQEDSNGGVDTTTSTAAVRTTAAPDTTIPAEVGAADIVPSVVQVLMVSGGEVISHGSGTVISDDGLILTNAHVATPFELEIDELWIAVTTEAQQLPEPRYIAEVVASDQALDLAVIRASTTLDGGGYDGGLVPLPVGDSDAVEIGDDLLIFGYPGIGGDTITFTRGLVSGFTGDTLIGERAWIKTDATIAGGNSGGLAANERGELVGIPTIAAAGEDIAEPVDCRPIRDTNRDGLIDINDDCVPLGGFLNGVRPSNVAADLIAAAVSGTPYEPVGDLPDPVDDPDPDPVDIDVSGVTFTNLLITDTQPVGRPEADYVWLETPAELCAWWEFEGMVDGVTYDAIWAKDGEIREDDSFISEVWAGGETGEFWVCVASDGSIDEGLWDLSLSVEGEFQAGTWVAVGSQYVPQEVSIYNELGAEVCYVYIAPTIMPFWGGDWLGIEQTMPNGEGLIFEIPPGEYDLRADDCSREILTITTFSVTGVTEVVLE
jgi:S1-C subfamily serine protease